MSSTAETTAQDVDLKSSPGDLAVAEEAFVRLLNPEPPAPEASEQAETQEDVVEEASAQAPPAQDDIENDDDEDDDEDVIEEAPPRYNVRVNGEDLTVDLDELKRGYSRQKDYTKKTQEVSEKRKAVSEQLQAVESERAHYAQILEGLKQQQLATEQAAPDWDQLRADDPAEYAVQWAEHSRRASQLQAIQAEQDRVRALQMEETQKKYQEHVKSQEKLLIEAIPAWSDSEVAAKEKAELIDYGKSIGFTDAELNNVTDHRSVVALRNAMRYATAKQNVKSSRPVESPTLKPGSSRSVPKRKSALSKAHQRLKKTGSTQDAAAIFEQMLGGKK